MAVSAPTGVAAINAGGMTLHSFLQLPMGLYLPDTSREINSQRRFSREKIRLLRALDLLVIDKISMVRADLLDAVDDMHRRHRDDSRVFGGVQLLMIGDLHQLPPVVKPEDWALLRTHDITPYFFGGLAFREPIWWLSKEGLPAYGSVDPFNRNLTGALYSDAVTETKVARNLDSIVGARIKFEHSTDEISSNGAFVDQLSLEIRCAGSRIRDKLCLF